MTNKLLDSVKLLLCMFFLFFACSDKEFFVQDLVQDESTIPEDVTFVSAKQAVEVANAFFNKQDGSSVLKSSTGERKVLVEAIKEGNAPLMYIVNYPEDGWAIVGASKDCYPVLAYSEKGNFELNPEIGGLIIWMDEVKQDIAASTSADDETKAKMHSMWSSYEVSKRTQNVSTMLKSANPLQDAYDQRLEQLNYQYANAGWYFCNYSNANLSSSAQAQILQNCTYYGCSPDYVIVGIKDTYNNQTVGPLVQTKWKQGSPYNVFVPNLYPAGCGAVAMAQIMNYHRYPANLYFNGVLINWNVMSDIDAALLIAFSGVAAKTNYGANGSSATTGNIVDALRGPFIYTVSRHNHNSVNVAAQLLNYQRPVIMFGTPAILNPNGHYWVCDGAQSINYQSYYFAEYPIPYGYQTYYYDNGTGNPWAGNPGNANGYNYLYLSMNWGWGSNSAWCIHTENAGYSNNREDLYISK